MPKGFICVEKFTGVNERPTGSYYINTQYIVSIDFDMSRLKADHWDLPDMGQSLVRVSIDVLHGNKIKTYYTNNCLADVVDRLKDSY